MKFWCFGRSTCKTKSPGKSPRKSPVNKKYVGQTVGGIQVYRHPNGMLTNSNHRLLIRRANGLRDIKNGYYTEREYLNAVKQRNLGKWNF